MKLQNLTPRQIQVLQKIKYQTSSKHCSPTLKQLAQELKLSRTTVFEHVAALREKGFLKASNHKARSLTLTTSASRLLKEIESEVDQSVDYGTDQVPLVGRVAAGYPIEAIQDQNTLSIASQFGSSDRLFALEVTGDSMIEEDIRDGDYVICKKSNFANNGQLAVIIVDEENATLKRFYNEKTHARLQPANENYQPIITSNCRIEAIVLGLVRKF